MSLTIKPGASVEVTVTKNPLCEPAAKTLSRIFLRDPENRRGARQRKRILRQTKWPANRGGRIWMNKNHAPRFCQPGAGDSCKIPHATVADIKDLESVERFISVK